MAKSILKLNAISPLADGVFEGYNYSDSVENPDGIMVRSAAMADYKVNDNLIGVARAGAGTNNIPCADYAEKGIVVFNTPGANANAVKELVICELFLGGRKITDAIDWVKTIKGEGDAVGKLVEKGKGKFVGCEIKGKTLGVIGLGAIGVAVANSAYALGMNVIGADPYLSTNNALSLSPYVKVVASREEVYKAADFITVHVPLNADTKAMINADTIALMKDGVVIINNSRGELADTAAVISALESGKLGRYITDFPNADLIGVNNCICVPHLGASTPEAEDNCAVMAAQQLADYIENGNIKNSVNYPAISLPRSGAGRLSILHKNVANLIAKFTSAISATGLNISNMASTSKGDYAASILEVDGIVSDELIKAIYAVDGVLRVRSL
ncbi:MAG: 3-phosphoglycerate dehydrogenase family protein [Clostridia bacterium]|nr:3-phosphoglycerate dehydrogenase family protein [Clostridia bacterium]